MSKVDDFIKSCLMHAEPQFYDPVKAHEYYLKNRELQDRQSSTNLKTDSKRQGWTYAKSQLKEVNKTDVTSASDANKVAVDEIRKGASERRTAIRDKLSAIFDQLSIDRKTSLVEISDNSKNELLKIENETQAKLDALLPIPKGISASAREKLSIKRSEEIAKIRGESKSQKDGVRSQASNQRTGVSVDIANKKQTQRDSTSSEREQLGSDLKASIDSARTNYETIKQDLKDKYETAKQTEYDAIAALR